MNTYYIPVHYYERDNEDDAVVKLVIQTDIGKCELEEILDAEYRRHNPADFASIDDMADAVFGSFAKRTGGVWSYCDTLSPLTVGDPDRQDNSEAELRQVDTSELASLLIKLEAGEKLTFFMAHNEETGVTSEAYGVTLISEFDSHMLLINYLGGGSPCAIDVTCYDSDLKRIRNDLDEYFRYIDPSPRHVYIWESDIRNIEKRDKTCQ